MRVLTYGTFDLFHYGHLRLLERLKAMGSHLTVGVSTDEFNRRKGKQSLIPFYQRIEIVKSVRFVDEVFAENTWEQKADDIKVYEAQILGMGDDWKGAFDHLASSTTRVVYLDRTAGVSSTTLRSILESIALDDEVKKIYLTRDVWPRIGET
jgi:glycerol-3-phosphate cytidylyltransferase